LTATATSCKTLAASLKNAMKNLYILFFLISLNCFCQTATKKELKSIISELIRINKKNEFSELKLIADNTDSVFYKSEKIILYTNRFAPDKKNICRTIELDFHSKKMVSFQDCQSCKEPSSCYVITDKTFYTYQIVEENGQLFLNFQNNYGSKKYLIINTTRNESNRILEIELRKV
jgi:hypothetical protein